jgi:pimeloyl-ACP methyl ester carboxylesterase
MPSSHSIRAAFAAAALALPLGVLAQQPAPAPQLQEAGTANFTIFLRGAPIGTEQVALTRTATGWTVISSGRLGAPIDAVERRTQVRYTADWKPLEFTFDGIVRGVTQAIHTTIDGTTATSEITSAGQAKPKIETIDANAVLLFPSSFFGPYEALAARLKTAAPGNTLSAYIEPLASIAITVGESFAEQIQTASKLVNARRTRITMAQPGGSLDADLWTDDTGRMIRFSVPLQNLEVVREDIAAVSSRSVTISRPNDQPVSIPSNGFTLAGTVSKPSSTSAERLPAVVLVGGSGPTDRDGLAVGIPILGQIAGALADARYIGLRYDKRGIGQSGGRAESATFTDYADDVRAAVKLLADRKDVDPKRIAVVGHSEGGLIALMAAAKDKKIDAVGLIATPGVTGADIVLAQQKRLLDRTKLTPEEKQAKVEEQKRIHQAVITGKGLELLPPAVRRSVDNPEFLGILTTDPAKLMTQVKQPLLIVQGELDTQVEPRNADTLAALARQRKNAAAVDVVRVPAINHLLVPATTGEVSEYADLKDKHVSGAVTQAIVSWLNKTLVSKR